MTYRDFVNRPLILNKRVLHKADEVAFKLSLCEKVTSVLGERVQTSPSNVTEKSIVAYIDSKAELDKMVEELNEAKDEVRDFFYANLDFDDADLLEWKYINAKDLKEIAKIEGLAYQTVKNKIYEADRVAASKFIKSVPKSTEKY